MTDRETIVQMLTRANIKYSESAREKEDRSKADFFLTVEDGYVGFEVIFEFRADGSLMRLAAWE